MRLYRQGAMPITTVDAIEKQLQQDASDKIVYNFLEAHVATSGDLGFVTGPLSKQVLISGTTETKPGKYLRIWKKEEGETWKIVLDLIAF
jgi:ketosteroid isomerase-like protein